MRSRSNFKRIFFALALVSAGFVIAAKSQAATSANPKGITISPAFQQITIQPGETDHPIQFSITNNEQFDQTVRLSSADFNSLNETGGLFFVGTNASNIQKNYGLVKWLSLPQTQYVLPAGKTQTISASLQKLDTMPGGGHYGALLISIGNQAASPSKGVAIHPIASSLFFVTKADGALYDMHLQSLSSNASWNHIADKATARFENTGNTHIVPRGIVSLMQGNSVISRTVINDSSSIVLPGSTRRFGINLGQVGKLHHGIILTSYKIRIDYRYDGNPNFATHEYGYRALNIANLVVFVVIVAVAAAGIPAYRNLKSWDKPAAPPKTSKPKPKPKTAPKRKPAPKTQKKTTKKTKKK